MNRKDDRTNSKPVFKKEQALKHETGVSTPLRHPVLALTVVADALRSVSTARDVTVVCSKKWPRLTDCQPLNSCSV